MGPWLKVSSERQEESEIKPTTPGLQEEPFIHYTKVAPNIWFLNG